MNDSEMNFYRIDDICIRVGYGCLVLFILITGTIISNMVRGLVLANRSSMYTGMVMFGLPAATFLAIGYWVRSREKSATAVRRALGNAPEIAARDLMAGTGLSRGRIEKAILAINRRGRGFYVWDRETDLITDARLRQGMILVESCDRCGAKIGKSFPVSMDRAPTCSYCGNPLNMQAWNDRKQKVIDAMRADDLHLNHEGLPSGGARQSAFSRPLFIILLLLFWPAALIYALARYNGR